MKRTFIPVLVLLLMLFTACGRKGNSEIQMLQEQLANAKIGDFVEFGIYEQDNNNANGKEKIEWKILAKENTKVLLISRYGLDTRMYGNINAPMEAITWQTSALRKWLNGDFAEEAFSSEELEIIETTDVITEKHPKYNSDPGNDTKDKIFLLSINEAKEYFDSDEKRKCFPTAYAIANEANCGVTDGSCSYWLRSPGSREIDFEYVDYDGSVGLYGGFPSIMTGVCIRPAIWVNLATNNANANFSNEKLNESSSKAEINDEDELINSEEDNKKEQIENETEPPKSTFSTNLETIVYDKSNRMTEIEQNKLSEKIDEIESEYEIDFAFIILNENLTSYVENKTGSNNTVRDQVKLYAKNFITDNNMGIGEYKDAFVFVDNWNRDADGHVYSAYETSGRADILFEEMDYYKIFDPLLETKDDLDPYPQYSMLIDNIHSYLEKQNLSPSDIDNINKERENARKNLNKEMTEIANAEIGQIITFGAYEQDNNSDDGLEKIEWIVLDKEKNHMLVLSRYALDTIQFQKENDSGFLDGAPSWEYSFIRKWLNNTFLNEAFSEDEQMLMPQKNVVADYYNDETADLYPDVELTKGNNTNDKVFLLGVDDVEKYLLSKSDRLCKPTVYCDDGSWDYDYAGENCEWWLRSIIKPYGTVALINSAGDISYNMSWTDFICVRPAIWICYE